MSSVEQQQQDQEHQEQHYNASEPLVSSEEYDFFGPPNKSSALSWLNLESIRHIVFPFENGASPQHMRALVVVNFIALFAHFAKTVLLNTKPIPVMSRFFIYVFLLAVPALFVPVVFFVGFGAVVVYQYVTSGKLHVF